LGAIKNKNEVEIIISEGYMGNSKLKPIGFSTSNKFNRK